MRELGSRRQHGHAGTARARERCDAGRSERAELDGAQPHAGLHDHVAGSDVTAARPHVSAGGEGARNLDTVVSLDNDLERGDGVGAVGHDTARRDRHRLARGERPAGGAAGGNAGDDGQRSRQVGGAYGEAVHRRAHERRQVDHRPDGGRGHASRSFLDPHRLRRQRLHAGEHARLRLVERQHRHYGVVCTVVVVSVVAVSVVVDSVVVVVSVVGGGASVVVGSP